MKVNGTADDAPDNVLSRFSIKLQSLSLLLLKSGPDNSSEPLYYNHQSPPTTKWPKTIDSGATQSSQKQLRKRLLSELTSVDFIHLPG